MKNILILVCDQLSFSALKAYGNTYSKTPSIDGLAEKGIVFDRAYTNCPLCQPARVPFVLSGGALERDIAQKRELPCRFASVTSLLDLLPTLADYAGIRVPESVGGVSRGAARLSPKISQLHLANQRSLLYASGRLFGGI